MDNNIFNNVELAIRFVEKYGENVKHKFTDSFNPYTEIVNVDPHYKDVSFVQRLKDSTMIWCYLLDGMVDEFEEMISADFCYYTEVRDCGTIIGYIEDNLTGEVCHTFRVEELIQSNTISDMRDLLNVKLYCIKRGVISDSHTLVMA